MSSLLIVAACILAVYAAFILALIVAGRGRDARDVARFIPDCVVLVRRLMGDPRVPRRHKLLLGGLVGYLALPIDLVPDFIPVAGQLDDAIIVALVLRRLVRSVDSSLVAYHWPGPEPALDMLMRLAGLPAASAAARSVSASRRTGTE